jgi:hypothetical protein
MQLVDFEPVKEEWTVVELEDRTILRMRPVLLLFRRDSSKKKKRAPRGAMRFQLQFAIWAKTKGKPSKLPITVELMQQHVVKRNLSFRFLRRGESTYDVEGQKFQLKAIPTQFDKTSLFDRDGEPTYLVQHDFLAGQLPASAEKM